MFDLTGKAALVTGASGGIGSDIARALHKQGATVALSGTRKDALDGLAAELGARTHVLPCNLSDAAAVDALPKQAEEAMGSLDILVNNAGITRHARDHADLDALSRQDFLDIYAVNVAGPFLMMQACKTLLAKCYEDTGRAAAVLNVSSIAGVTGVGSSVAYAASKGAFNTMTLSLARALAPAIRVNAICPGFIGTRWFKDQMGEEQYKKMEAGVAASVPLHVASGPDDIADSAVFFCTDASRHVTGETLLVDAGMHLGYAPLVAR